MAVSEDEIDDGVKTYSKFVENGINAHSMNILVESMGNFCTPDVRSILYFPKGNPHSHSYRELQGINVTSDFLHKNFSSAPDSIFLVHNTQVNYEPDGSVVVTAKFTCNGTRLYTVTAQQNGSDLPPPPSAIVLYNTIKLIHPHSLLHNFYHFMNSVDSSRQQVTLRKGGRSKFDRYKNEHGVTIGAHVEYATFSETSMQNKKKKLSELDCNGDGLDSQNGVKVNRNKGKNTRKDKKNLLKHSAAGEYQPQNTSKQHLTAHQAATVNALTSQISSKFTADEIMIADDSISFGYSPLLPVPISYEVFGIMKLYLNAENKAYIMEVMLASKEIKIPQ